MPPSTDEWRFVRPRSHCDGHLVDRVVKWQMAALASHYTKLPVYEMVAMFEEDRRLKSRLIPLAILPLLAVCLVWDAVLLPILIVATMLVICTYCAILFKGWMRLIRSA
jgi:hypothetical protein